MDSTVVKILIWFVFQLDVRVKFRNYRRDIADTFIYCYYVLRAQFLNVTSQQFQTVLTEGRPDWQSTEAMLFSIRSVSEVVENSEHVYIPRVMAILFSSMPRSIPRLTQTAISFLGA